MLLTKHITQIPTDAPAVYAFRIADGVEAAEMGVMAELIDLAFDRHDKIKMLLILENFGVDDALRSQSFQSVSTQIRSISHVSHYAVVGAPTIVAAMIEAFDKILPVSAQAFSPEEEGEAWAFVGAKPAGERR